MAIALIIFLLALFIYIPLAIILLYVWWKYGRNELGIAIARSVFLAGSVALVAYMIIL